MSASSDYTEYVEALQDYKYRNDKGEDISIAQGSYYILLERTNAEWWHIQDMSTPMPKDFYVPAHYVQCLGRFPEEHDEVFEETGKPCEEFYSDEECSDGSSGEENEEPIKIVVPKGKPLPQIPPQFRPKPSTAINAKSANRVSTFGKPMSPTPPPDYSDDHSDCSINTSTSSAKKDSPTPQQKIVCVEIDESPTVLLPKSEALPSPKKLTDPGRVLPPVDKMVPPVDGQNQTSGEAGPKVDPVVYANLDDVRTASKPASEMQGQNEYANLSAIQSVLKPPAIPNPKDLVKVLTENWELYRDAETGRSFYFNTATKETSWKPPRGVDLKLLDGEVDSHVVDKQHHTNGNRDHTTEQHSPIVPKGWRVEVTPDNGKVYINEVTKAKWFASVDASGRQYFYKDGSQESVWQLPELCTSSQSISDSLSHVDVASRKAALRERLHKTKSMYVDNQERLDTNRKSTTLPHNLMIGHNNNVPTTNQDDGPIAGNLSPVSQVFPKDTKDRFLNKAKVMENGKKLKKKNWSVSYVVLSGSNLVFYKDQKSSLTRPGSPHGKPEFVVNLLGANIEFGSKELTSKKNVILLTTAHSNEDATQYLLQTDDASRIHHWYISLTDTVDRMRQGLDLPTTINGSPVKTPQVEHEKLKRGKSTKGKPSPSSLQRSISSDEAVSQERKRRIRDILYNFITRRPSPEVLKEKGIIKEAVFGCELKHLCERERSPVPEFIKRVVAAIEAQGLDHDGMYRVNGNASLIQKLRCTVDQGDNYVLEDSSLWDIHVLTGALKLFFRELKEPLFPFDSYSGFEKAIMLPSSSDKLKAFKERISQLPKCNHETIRFLFKHLQKVTCQSRENRMQSHNLAIVFGPTLLWPQLRAANLAYSLVFQNRIVEFVLLEYDNLFK